MNDEYPPEARFGWDLIEMTDAEIEAMCAAADEGDVERADAIVSTAAERIFGEHVQ
jgi:hypothetical protein